VASLGRNVVWLCHPGAAPPRPWAEDIAPAVVSALRGVGADSVAAVDAAEVAGALVAEPGLQPHDRVFLLRPEMSAELNYCQWDGDGHFNMKNFPGRTPPTLGQIVSHLRIVDQAVKQAPAVVHLTSQEHLARGAVLAGAVLVLVCGMSAREAWQGILRGCPAPDPNPEKAWDRFSAPFSPNGVTCGSSLTVLDCLAGLEVAQRLRWLEDYRTFDIEGWRYMRRKFDASWIIPGEMLALGDPQLTAQNPSFPRLLADADCKPGGPLPQGTLDSAVLSSASTSSTEAETPKQAGLPTCTGFQEPESHVKDEASAMKLRRVSSGTTEPGLNATISQLVSLQTESFASFFLRVGIEQIVRLNFRAECQQELSCPESLHNIGTKVLHYEFEDGNVPEKKLLRSFLKHCDDADRHCMAVHCKAGLGRTGIMVGAYAVERHKIDGKAFHGWVRLCRPGCVQTLKQERFLRSLTPEKASSGWSCFRVTL